MTGTPILSTAEPRSTRPFNTWDGLKLLGLLCMIIDHTAFFYLDENPLLRAIGQPGIAIFLFLTGYAPRQRITKELALAAALLFAINTYLSGISTLNILFTIMIGRFLLMQVDAGRLKLGRPLEWMVVLLMLFPSVILFQTGSMGLLFILAGYLQQHKERYSLSARAWFFWLTFALYTAADIYALKLAPLYALVLIVTMTGMGWLLWNMQLRPVRVPAERVLRFLARHMLWVYVIHFGAMQLLTGKGY